GSPVLVSEQWVRALQEEGFINSYRPEVEANCLGQQIIVAESNGAIRQGRTDIQPAVSSPGRKTIGAAERTGNENAVVAAPLASPNEDIDRALREKTIAYFKNQVRQSLKLTSQEIDTDKDLNEYGLDSILVVGMNNVLAKDFDDLSSTLFFEMR